MTDDTPNSDLVQLSMFDEDQNPIQRFDDVRRILHNGLWHFSIVDVVARLTNSHNPRKYWNKLAERLRKEGNETVTECHQLKLLASDGKLRLTDVATEEQLLRIIQSIPSPYAEPFKLWLAQIGAQHLEDQRNPERAVARYEGKISRKEFANALLECLSNPSGYDVAIATNKVYKELFSRDFRSLCELLHTKRPRDVMDVLGLRYLDIAEKICARQFGEQHEISRFEALEIVGEVTSVIGRQIQEIEQVLGIDVVTGRKLLGPTDAIRG